MAKCRNRISSTLTTVLLLLGPRETTLAVVRFIITTRAGRRPREKKLEKEAE